MPEFDLKSAAALRTKLEHLEDASASGNELEIISCRPDWVSVRIPCKAQLSDAIILFFCDLMDDLSSDLASKLAIGLREILDNAIEHGCGFDSNEKVELMYLRTSKLILFRISDPGSGFSLDALPHTALNKPPDQPFLHVSYRDSQGIRPGGYGLLMAQRIMDDMVFSEKGNEVVLIKYL